MLLLPELLLSVKKCYFAIYEIYGWCGSRGEFWGAWEGLQLLSANGGRFEINQLLLADDTALVAESEETLCRLVSEFGRVCERRKLRVNVRKSKVVRCSRYGNGDRMHVILNGEPLEEVDGFKYLGSQMAADGGCEK